MDFGDITDNLPIIISVIVLILLQFFMRRRRSANADNLGIVQGLLSETRLNIRMADIFSYSKAGRKFMTTTWKLYNNKLSFLGGHLETTVSNAYMLAEESNQQIAASKKFKSTSYLSSIDITKLKNLMTDTEEGLEEWLATQPGAEEASAKTPGIFDDFTGRR